MLLDQSVIFSDRQVLTATAASSYTLDLAAAGNAVQGALYVVARLDESLKGATKLTVALQTADTADFSNAKELVSWGPSVMCVPIIPWRVLRHRAKCPALLRMR